MKRAEELGYARAWFYDTQLLNADMFVAMAAAAMQTATIRLTTGVLIPSNRIAAVAASALASLNALATGRIDFGISTGFTARRSMGLGPVKLADMKEYIRIVRGLLAGDTLEWDFGEKRRKIRFLNPEIGAFNVTDPVPLHIPALGPRGRKLTAELGAGWIFTAANVAFAKAAVADMLSAWKSTGIDPAVRVATAFTGGRVLKDGEPYDSPRVKAPSDEKVARLLAIIRIRVWRLLRCRGREGAAEPTPLDPLAEASLDDDRPVDGGEGHDTSATQSRVVENGPRLRAS